MHLATHIALVAFGGASGALLRTGLGTGLTALVGHGAPGTLAANLLGCLLMGAGRGAVHHFEWGSPQTRAFVFSGFLGAFTTFSTFEADLATMWQNDTRGLAILYALVSVFGGILMFALGWWLAHTLGGDRLPPGAL